MVKQTILLVIRVTFGCILIVLGIIGLVVPMLPGWIFLIPGVGLLYLEIAFVYWAVKRRIGSMFGRVQSNEP